MKAHPYVPPGDPHEAIHTYPHSGGSHVVHASIPLVLVVNMRCSLLEVHCPSRLSCATLCPVGAPPSLPESRETFYPSFYD